MKGAKRRARREEDQQQPKPSHCSLLDEADVRPAAATSHCSLLDEADVRPREAMALRAFSCNPSLGGFGSENVGALAGRRRPQQDPVPTTSGDTRSIQSANRNGSNAAQGRQHTEPNHVDSYGYGGGGGDAFAQILKELVDNAVDACCAAAVTSETSCRTTRTSTTDDHGADDTSTSTSRALDLKRVRVVIEPVATSSGRAQDDAKEASTASPPGTKKELLRVSVNDNGVGMSSIEDCVEAFRTSKRSNDRFPPDNSQSSVGTGSMSGSVGAAESQQPKPPGEGQTAGRYGIGLTLCLLHSQRLCPNSVASITSATADAIQWTRASYVVDTEGDRVRCVKKELLDKKAGESGTMVSLLVPVSCFQDLTVSFLCLSISNSYLVFLI